MQVFSIKTCFLKTETMKKLKTKIYQYAANQLYVMAEDMMFNERMFDMIMSFAYQLDFICTEQNIYLD